MGIIAQTGSAQSVAQPCGFDHQHQSKIITQADYESSTHEFEEALLAYSSTIKNRSVANYTIPVVVHVMHLPSDANPGEGSNIPLAQIEIGLVHLNEAFRNQNSYSGGPFYTNAGVPSVDTQIEFCLADTAPNGQSTDGVNRIPTSYANLNTLQFANGFTELYNMQSLSAWDSNNYLNVWIVKSICEYSNGQGCGLVGLSSFPPSHGYLDDGVVVEAAFWGTSEDNSKVQIHEVGHYLGLYHTFQGGCGESNCMIGGDKICDTPPDNSTSSGGTGVTINSCATDSLINNSPFTNNVQDIYENYMDYSANSMKNTFTPMQKLRMEASLTNQRASLLSSQGCASAALPLELISYEITKTSEGVAFNWQTINETDVDYFLIEQSIDGHYFEKMGVVNAQNGLGNSYIFSFPIKQPGTFYFRITEVDTDNRKTHFDIKALNFSSLSNTINIYPNPIQGNDLFISFSDHYSDKVEIAIINMSGKTIFQQSKQLDQQAQFNLAIPNLSSGLYYVRLMLNQQSFIKKLIVK